MIHHKLKRSLALVLVLTTLTGLLSISASAAAKETAHARTAAADDREVPQSSAADGSSIVDSGTCGKHLTWTLDSKGTLTISGTGSMSNYADSESDAGYAPWSEKCESIKKVVIKEGVTTIGNYAFDSCEMRSLTIPASITHMGDGIIGGCFDLKSISVDDKNRNYSSSGGVLFNKAKTTLICYPLAKSGAYTIPDGVTAIQEGAFDGSIITCVTIPSSVTNIEDGAFSYCSDLSCIYFKGDAPNIGEDAFTNITNDEMPKLTVYYPTNNSTWTQKQIDYYMNHNCFDEDCTEAGIIYSQIIWKTWIPTDSHLSKDENHVISMLNRITPAAVPMLEYHDPLDLVLDYFSGADLTKMTITVTGKHLTSSGMWQEAYRRTLTAMLEDSSVPAALIEETEFVNDLNEKLLDEIGKTLEKQSVSVSSATFSLLSGALKDVSQHTAANIYILSQIYEHTDDKDLKAACEQIMQKRMVNLQTAILKTLASNVPTAAQSVLEAVSKESTAAFLTNSAALLKGLGYVCESIDAVGTILFVKDVITSVNGWSNLTSAYQDIVANSNIRSSLFSVYRADVKAYTAGNSSRLASIGITFHDIESVTQNSYENLKAALGSRYVPILSSDSHLNARVSTVKSISITNYNKRKCTYMTPRCDSYAITAGKSTQIKLSNVRYQSKTTYKVTSGSSLISINNSGKVKAKTAGTGIVTIVVQQNGGKKYTAQSIITVNPKGSSLTSAKNAKGNKLTVKWKKNAAVTGYQIQYSTSSKFNHPKTISVKPCQTTSKTISKLTKNEKYYVRVRTYKAAHQVNYYSAWSSSKNATIKK